MKYAGFCLGASNIGLVLIERKDDGTLSVQETRIKNHEGDVVGTLKMLLQGLDLSEIESLAVTGRKFRDLVSAESLSEAEAIEIAYDFVKASHPDVDTIVSAGAEAFIAYKIDAHGRIADVFTGNKCASGTGEFFLQQIQRMGFAVEEAMTSVDMETPYQVAGRCSVFCKSDCTHALNKGETKPRVVGGLCQMMSAKIMELLHRARAQQTLLIGGATQNQAMVDFIRRETRANQVVSVPVEADYFEALGAALWAVKHGKPTWRQIDDIVKKQGMHHSFGSLPALRDFADRVTFKSMEAGIAQQGDYCIVGLDVGSTTTKAIILRTSDDAMLASVYLRTNGDPVQASRECYQSLA